MKTPIAVAAALTLVIAGCKSSEKEMHSLADSWQKHTVAGTYDKFVVMGLIEDHEQRVALETAVAKDLEKRGHDVVLGYKALKDLDKFNAENFASYCKTHDIKAAVTITVDEDVAAVQRTDVAVMANANFTRVIEASATTTDVADDFIVDVLIWDAMTWKPIWAGRSETFDEFEIGPGGVDEFVASSVTAAKL